VSPKPSKNSPAAGELSGLLRKAEELQRELEKAQAELRNEVVRGEGGGGKARLEIAGDGSPQRVEIRVPGLSPEQAREVEEALQSALRQALERLFQLRRDRLGRVTGNIQLPGLYH